MRCVSSDCAPCEMSGPSIVVGSLRSWTEKWCRRVIGRRTSTTTSTGPLIERSHAPSSFALLTVADRQTNVTLGGASTRTSSHTPPR